MKKSFAAIIVLLVLFSTAYGQKKDKNKDKITPQELFDDAESFYESEDYKEALFNYLKLHELKPENANFNYMIGMCYLGIPGDEPKAIPFLEKAVTKISTQYKQGVYEESKAPLVALFYLGIAYRTDNRLAESLEAFNKFKNHKSFEGTYNENVVNAEIQASERAKIIQDKPINVRRTNVGEPINNTTSNYHAVVTPDETLMVYMNSLKFYNAIYMSRKVNGVWTEPVNISPDLAADGDCEPTSVSADGQELYIVKRIKNSGDIYVSHWNVDRWMPMLPLNKNINTSRNESHASISADGKTLYFSSDRRGGFGKLDIYKSEKDASGNWGVAVNMGDRINSDANENMPFICEDGKTLYFCSEGHLNMGGYDIFMSTYRIDKQWDPPVNVGFPINTTSNDLFYMPLKNGEIAYCTLIKPEGFGKEDIYRVENLTVQSQHTNKGVKSKVRRVIVKDKITNETLGVLQYDQEVDSVKVEGTNSKVVIKIDE